jgi:hypothetical protein
MVLEIQKVLTISTGNLSRETRADMSAKSPGPCIAWDYGWWVGVPTEWEPHHEDDTPADLRAALELGEQSGCEWVRFDADAAAAEGLQWWEY